MEPRTFANGKILFFSDVLNNHIEKNGTIFNQDTCERIKVEFVKFFSISSDQGIDKEEIFADCILPDGTKKVFGNAKNTLLVNDYYGQYGV